MIRLLVVLLITFLPHHGAITVFAPEWMRFWKEGVIILLGLMVLVQGAKQITGEKWKKENWKNIFKLSQTWAFLFLLWGAILIALNPDPKTALIAFRYLGLGYVVYLIVSLVLKRRTTPSQNDGAKLSNNIPVGLLICCFLGSLIFSVLFGVWAQFLGGFEVLSSWYSQTISSWVPGQTLPLYHEASGIVRMQGTASGPIEFSHLLVVGLFFLLFYSSSILQTASSKLNKTVYLLVVVLFLLGIYASHSRAALLGVMVLFGIKGWDYLRHKAKLQKTSCRKFKVFFAGGILAAFLGLFIISPSLISRAGTSDHFTRPVAAIKQGMHNPIIGHLGQWGPAARAKNLQENNNDSAPIAENIFADYFVQLGWLGLVFALGFFWSLWMRFSFRSRVFLIVVLLLANMATIFDMTPISIIFFFFFAWMSKNTIKA